MKQYILLLIFSFAISGCNSQNNKPIENKKKEMDLSFISNNTLKYAIVLRACESCVPIKNIGYRVTLFMSENEKEIAKKITREVWLKLLNDSASDFSANIILYNFYDKDAFRLSKNDNKTEWRKDMKSDDIEYWKSHLK